MTKREMLDMLAAIEAHIAMTAPDSDVNREADEFIADSPTDVLLHYLNDFYVELRESSVA